MRKRAALFCALAAVAIGGLGSAKADPGGGQYIVVLKSGSDSVAVATKHKQKYGAELSQVYKHALKGYAATLSPKGREPDRR